MVTIWNQKMRDWQLRSTRKKTQIFEKSKTAGATSKNVVPCRSTLVHPWFLVGFVLLKLCTVLSITVFIFCLQTFLSLLFGMLSLERVTSSNVVILRNHPPMACVMLILTRGDIIFVYILNRVNASCKILTNIMPNRAFSVIL